MYVLMDEGKEEKKAKGVKKNVIKKDLRHENFVRSREHHIFTETIQKIALSADDDKRVVLERGIDTLAIGHWRLR